MLKQLRQLAIVSLLLPLSLPLHAAVNSTIPTKVEQALKANKVSPKSLSLVTIPLNGPGNSTYFNADISVNPASTMKLITTFAALELLGPNYQWATSFYTDGTLSNGVLKGNLYFKGGGDPKMNMEKLWLLLRDLRANGVTRVTGDLVLDRSYFIQPQLPAFNDDSGNSYKPYLVAPDALLINFKALRFIAHSESGRVQITTEPPIAGVSIVNRVTALKSGKCPSWRDGIRFTPTPTASGYTVTAEGKLAEGCTTQSYISLLDQPNYAAGTVRALWKELGGSIDGKDRQAPVPSKARLLSRAYSPDLTEIIRDINKYSNNTMARQLFLSIGAKFRTSADPDDAKAAQRVIRAWLSRKGITASQLVMENGSGLSRAERISAREMSKILQAAWNSPYSAEFISSMPLAGKDGTMRRRLRSTPMAGEAHIKTGTLNNVRAIAGFSRDNKGKTWAVVAIINDPKPWGASSVLDRVLLELQKQPAR